VIKTFRHKGLAELWSEGKTAKIDQKLPKRIMVRLRALEEAISPEQMNLPGFDFHTLKGFDPARFTIHVNGPWCITFAMAGEDVILVDFEQYH